MKQPIVKAISALLCGVIVLGLVFFAMGRLSALSFWILAALIALAAFVVLPRFRKI